MRDKCSVCGGPYEYICHAASMNGECEHGQLRSHRVADDHGDCAIQAQEMRAETFAAEAVMGMRAGTTEGWYDEPEPPDPYDERYDYEED